jgi:putative ABC transport system permease protein
MIGVAALLTLLAYGSGLQQNARSEFNALELYNTLRVTSQPNPISGMGDLAFRMQPDSQQSQRKGLPLTDSLVREIEQIEGVRTAYPEVNFPAQIKANERAVVANAEAVPQAFQSIKSYQPVEGAFFEAPDADAVLMGQSMAERLGFDPPASAVGDTVRLVTATLDLRALQSAGAALTQGLSALPIGRETYPLRVAGLLSDENQPVSGFTRVLLPLERARSLQKVTFFSTLDLLLRDQESDSGSGYAALRVQLASADDHSRVRQAINDMGVYATSFREQFDRLEQLFLIMDLALGIIGFIALVIATIGIANTVAMNVRERYAEIGVMKAVGGEEGDLQRLFVAESTMIGALGGIAGLVFGAGIITLLNWAVNLYLQQQGIPAISVFNTTVWMVVGIFSVALLISLAAGVFPARRAARVEPVEALRST